MLGLLKRMVRAVASFPKRIFRGRGIDSPHKQNFRQMAWCVLRVVGVGLAVTGLIALIQAGYSQSWTGFGDFTNPKGELTRGKTLWDWLQLLIIPAVLAFGVLLFNAVQRRADEKTAEQRDKVERDIANDRAQEALLQSYLDHMTELLLEKGLRTSLHAPKDDSEAKDTPEVVAVAQARTVTALRRLDQARRASLLTFLCGSGLIVKKEAQQDAIGLLHGADLSGADLSGAIMTDVDLSGANLIMANPGGAFLGKSRCDAATKWPEGYTPPPNANKVEEEKR
jgi:Pentapeptide repeats (8 copies)